MNTRIKGLISILGIIIIVFIFIKKEYKVYHYPEQDFHEGAYQIAETKLDSLNNTAREAKQKAESSYYKRNGYVEQLSEFQFEAYGPLGLANRPIENSKSNMSEESFLILTGMKLNLYEHVSKSYLQYYSKKNIGYLTRLKFIKNNGIDTVVHVDQKIDYRYFLTENWILMPLKTTFMKFVGAWLPKTVYLIIVTLYLFSALLFLLFLIAIYRNKAFSRSNLDRLRKIAISLLIISFIPYLVNGISYFLFTAAHSSKDVTFTYNFLDNDYKYLVLSILFYLLYTAFTRGMELQNEQALTI